MTGKELKLKGSYKTMYWLCGILMVGTGVFQMAVSGQAGVMLGCGVLFLIMAGWWGAAAIVRVHDDHIEVKAAPIAARKRVLFRELTEIDTSNPKKAILRSTNGEVVAIPMNMLDPDEGGELLEWLKEKVS